MLDIVRSKQKSLLIKVAFAVIIMSFVIGYTMLTAPTDQRTDQGRDVAATVNGDPISYAAYRTVYSNLYGLYQSIYQNALDANLERQLNLPRQALQQLIEELLLVQEAGRLNLRVGKQELVNSIAAYDAFQINGVFNRDRYLEVLGYQRISPEQFEEAQRRELLTRKVREHLQRDVTISQEEIISAFHRENDQISLDFVWLTPALVEAKVAVTDAALEQFFHDNKEQFRIPERLALRYLQFDPSRYEVELGAFSEDDLERYYRRNLELFEVEEQVEASHILLQIADGTDEETVAKRLELARSINSQLRDGADFAQLAKLHSDDKSNASTGGQLGRFGRGIMINEFEAAAFALRPGQISDVVRTPFGFHIIKVTDYTAAGFKPLVDVIDVVKAGLAAERSRQLAYEKAMDAYNINRRSGDLEAAARDNNLGIKETGFFAADESINGLGRMPEISAVAFTLQDGELARPIQTTEGVFLIAIKDRRPSRLPELGEVRAAVENAYRSQQSQTLTRELAEKLHEEARNRNNLIAAAQGLGLKVENTGDFNRGFGYFIPQIGSSQELADLAFDLTPENPVAPRIQTIGDRRLVAALHRATPADISGLDEMTLAQLRERLLYDKKEQTVADRLVSLYQQAKIDIISSELITAYQN